jgi:hypothetical protein
LSTAAACLTSKLLVMRTSAGAVSVGGGASLGGDASAGCVAQSGHAKANNALNMADFRR